MNVLYFKAISIYKKMIHARMNNDKIANMPNFIAIS